METYDEYEHLDKHIMFSRDLHLLDREGQHVLSELERTKVHRTKRNGDKVYSADISVIHEELKDITNTERFSVRLYFQLLHYLDEFLFIQVKNINEFLIEDEPYKITDLYFNQPSWNENADVHEYKFYDDSKCLNTEEAMYLKMYLQKYNDYIERLILYLNDCNSKYMGKTYDKLKDTLNRFIYKINGIQSRLLKLIKTDFEKNWKPHKKKSPPYKPTTSS